MVESLGWDIEWCEANVTCELLQKAKRELGKYWSPKAFEKWTLDRDVPTGVTFKTGVHSDKPEWEALGYKSQEDMEQWRKENS